MSLIIKLVSLGIEVIFLLVLAFYIQIILKIKKQILDNRNAVSREERGVLIGRSVVILGE
jgi:hypothetical protein